MRKHNAWSSGGRGKQLASRPFCARWVTGHLQFTNHRQTAQHNTIDIVSLSQKTSTFFHACIPSENIIGVFSKAITDARTPHAGSDVLTRLHSQWVDVDEIRG